MSTESKKLWISRAQLILTIVVLIVTVSVLFGSVQERVAENENDITELQSQQPEITRSLHEIQLNLKYMMEYEGLTYQEAK